MLKSYNAVLCKTKKMVKSYSRISGMFERYGWKLVIKLENSDKPCRQKARDSTLEYLVSRDRLSLSPKGNYEVTTLDCPEKLIDSREKNYYFRDRDLALDYAREKYASKDRNSQEYGKLPSGVSAKISEPI